MPLLGDPQKRFAKHTGAILEPGEQVRGASRVSRFRLPPKGLDGASSGPLALPVADELPGGTIKFGSLPWVLLTDRRLVVANGGSLVGAVKDVLLDVPLSAVRGVRHGPDGGAPTTTFWFDEAVVSSPLMSVRFLPGSTALPFKETGLPHFAAVAPTVLGERFVAQDEDWAARPHHLAVSGGDTAWGPPLRDVADHVARHRLDHRELVLRRHGWDLVIGSMGLILRATTDVEQRELTAATTDPRDIATIWEAIMLEGPNRMMWLRQQGFTTANGSPLDVPTTWRTRTDIPS